MVEQALLRHDVVHDCAVVALADADVGERVAAVCVVAPGARRVSEHELVQAAAAALPAHAVPEYVWVRAEPLPRNPTGKVLKTELRDAVRARVDAERRRGVLRWHRTARM